MKFLEFISGNFTFRYDMTCFMYQFLFCRFSTSNNFHRVFERFYQASILESTNSLITRPISFHQYRHISSEFSKNHLNQLNNDQMKLLTTILDFAK